MDSDSAANKQIVEILSNKSNLKSKVYDKMQEIFSMLKDLLGEISNDLDDSLDTLRDEGKQLSKRVKLEYRDRGKLEAELYFADDVLVFSLLPDIYKFDRDHPINGNPYASEGGNVYCGIINIYNFLNESIRFNREDDLGYLVARIFINSDGAFFVEGKRQSFNKVEDFGKNIITRDALKSIVENAMLYALSFDLLVPRFDDVKITNVEQMNKKIDNSRMKTGKRLGFNFRTDDILG